MISVATPRPDDDHDPAERQRYCFIERARCTVCGSDDLKTKRSIAESDGSITRPTTCRACGHDFVVVVE